MMIPSCGDIETYLTPKGFGTDDAPDLTLIDPDEVSNIVPVPESDPISDWIPSPCTSSAKYRFLSSGKIEVLGKGVMVSDTWLSEVDDWREPIESSAGLNGISPAILAATVAMVSGGNENYIGPDGKIGLTQIDVETAKRISGARRISIESVMHPIWNLIHGAKYLSKCLNEEYNNIVGSIIKYRYGFVRCSKESEWGILETDPNYINEFISVMNRAVDEGYPGVMFVDLGDEIIEDTEDNHVIKSMAILGAITIGAYGVYKYGVKGK